MHLVTALWRRKKGLPRKGRGWDIETHMHVAFMCVQKLDKEMKDIQAKSEKLNAQMAETSDLAKLQELSNALVEMQNQLDEKEMRWLELAEIAGDI
jgi:hypothetical protein